MDANNIDIVLVVNSLFDQFRFIMEHIARCPLALVAAGCAICSGSMYLFKFLTSSREVF